MRFNDLDWKTKEKVYNELLLENAALKNKLAHLEREPSGSTEREIELDVTRVRPVVAQPNYTAPKVGLGCGCDRYGVCPLHTFTRRP